MVHHISHKTTVEGGSEGHHEHHHHEHPHHHHITHSPRHSVRKASDVAPQVEILTSEGTVLPPPSRCHDEVIILKGDMPEREKDAALDKLRRLQHKYTLEKDIAYKLKKHMEKVFEGYWSSIIGSSFGCFVSHVQHEYLQVRSGGKEIILYKAA